MDTHDHCNMVAMSPVKAMFNHTFPLSLISMLPCLNVVGITRQFSVTPLTETYHGFRRIRERPSSSSADPHCCSEHHDSFRDVSTWFETDLKPNKKMQEEMRVMLMFS